MLKQKILHYPQLDTIMMVERFVQKHNAEYRKKELWQKMPKKMMYQTYSLIIDYLIETVRIGFNRENKIVLKTKESKYHKAFDTFSKKLMEKYGNEIIKITLFGSVARGDYTKDSDIDILVITNNKDISEIKKNARDIAYDLMLETGIYVSPKVYFIGTYAERLSGGSMFFTNIEREGENYARN